MNASIEKDDLPVVDELTSLKARADQLGITYHPSIGVDKLREKVNAALATEPEEETSLSEDASERMSARDYAGRLIRVRITCMNPNKKDVPGEIITVSNAVAGTYKKYIPFHSGEPYHVPQIIFNMLKDREFQAFTTVKGPNGITLRKAHMVKEFAIEVLPDLTEQELKDLAQRQAMAKSVD